MEMFFPNTIFLFIVLIFKQVKLMYLGNVVFYCYYVDHHVLCHHRMCLLVEEEGRQFLSPIVSNELQMLWKCLTIKKNILSRPEIQAYLN